MLFILIQKSRSPPAGEGGATGPARFADKCRPAISNQSRSMKCQ